jgi:hypothetical protein
MYFEEFTRRVQCTGTLSVALGLVTALQGFSMFFGLRDLLPVGSIEALLVPPAGAVVVAIAFWFVWHWLLLVVPLAHDPAKRAMGLMVGAVLTAVSIGTTSWFIASSIGGSRAVQAHMNAYVSDASRQLGLLTANAAAEQSLTGLISEIAAGWRGVAEAEARHGTVSGRAGAGPRADSLRRSAEAMDALQASVNGRFRAFEEERAKTETLIADMTRLANAPAASTTDGQTRFADMAARLYQAFAGMERITALPLVEQTGRVQVEEKAGIIATRDEAQTKRLADAARRIRADRRPVELQTYLPTTKAVATLDHAGSVPGAWIVGVGFDLLPLVMLALLMLAYAEAREPFQPRKPFAVVGGREAA